MTPCTLALSVALGAGLPGSLGAALSAHLQAGLAEARVGDWVTYQADGGGGRVAFWRLAIVGEERDRDGRDAFWLELDVGDHPGLEAPLSQMRFLVAKGVAPSRGAITRIVAGFASLKPQELADDAVGAVERPLAPGPAPGLLPDASPRLRAREGPEARLMTAAGTVAAIPVDVYLGDTSIERLWLSRQVPVLHLAKIEVPAIGHSLEVRDFGTNARPRLTTPAPNEPKIHLEPHGTVPIGEPSEGASDARQASLRP